MKAGDRLSAWTRRRELASDRRAGQFARSEVARLQRDWVRRHWLILGAELLFILVVVVLVLLLPGWASGFAAGALLATGLLFVAFQVVLESGTAPRMMGERGEQFTASELRRLRRHGWRVMNGLRLKPRRDIDHIAVGPSGVLVIETKWSGNPWTLDSGADNRVRGFVDRVAADATDVRRMFPNNVAATAIFPLLVLWDGHKPTGAGVRAIDGVTVLRGSELRRWLAAFEPESSLSTAQQDHVWRTLQRHVERRDAADRERDGPPRRTPGEVIGSVARILLAFWLGLVLQGWALQVGYAFLAAAEAAFLLAGWFALRHARAVAIAWLASVLGVGLLVGVAALVDRL